MSALRARCPDCRTLTAVAIGPEYQCHSCGREFAAGLVRIGDAELDLPWPEAARLAGGEDPAGLLPKRPIVLAADASARRGVERALGSSLPWFDAADPRLADPERLEQELAALPTPAGAGFSGFGGSAGDARLVARLARALGL